MTLNLIRNILCSRILTSTSILQHFIKNLMSVNFVPITYNNCFSLGRLRANKIKNNIKRTAILIIRKEEVETKIIIGAT